MLHVQIYMRFKVSISYLSEKRRLHFTLASKLPPSTADPCCTLVAEYEGKEVSWADREVFHSSSKRQLSVARQNPIRQVLALALRLRWVESFGR